MLKSFMNQTHVSDIADTRASGISIFSARGAVNADTAQRIVWVLGAVDIKANTLATIPLKVYENNKNGKYESKDHNLYELLRYAPNPHLTAAEWAKMKSQDLDLRGNHYAQVVRNGLGKVVAIYPLVADKMQVEFDSQKRKLYKYDNKKVPSNQILHFMDTPDKEGLKGLSKIEYAKEAFLFANQAQSHGNKVFKNSVSPTGAFEHPGELGEDEYQRLKADLEEKYTGLNNAGRPILLEAGLKFTPMSIKNSDAQWIESMKYNREQIATIFGVPSAMLNDTANTAYNNLEQKHTAFYTGTILPRTIMIEQRMRLSLLTVEEKKKLSIKYKYNSLMRVDAKTRAEYYKTRYNTGSMSPNEIREYEDENGFDGGDNYFMQLNMTTVDNIVKGDSNE